MTVLRSLGGNSIGPQGAAKLVAVLSQTQITNLGCAAPRTQVFAFLSAPVDTPPALGSLGFNQLCGVDRQGRGTYTTEVITKLCEGLKGSAVTSLKCAP